MCTSASERLKLFFFRSSGKIESAVRISKSFWALICCRYLSHERHWVVQKHSLLGHSLSHNQPIVILPGSGFLFLHGNDQCLETIKQEIIPGNLFFNIIVSPNTHTHTHTHSLSLSLSLSLASERAREETRETRFLHGLPSQPSARQIISHIFSDKKGVIWLNTNSERTD